ncbi:MAG: LysR family transcriptional regulator [Nannocystaceae bacterium]
MSKSIRTKAKPLGKNAKPSIPAPAAPPAADRLHWDDFELLLALTRSTTLSGAALRLAVNTSTVGRRLDALEQRLGLHLFDRSPAGLAATELARALVPVAESIEHAVADGMRVVEGRETEPEGVVRITAPPGLANWFLAPAIVELRRRYPGLRIDLEAAVGYADLTRREADLALRIRRPLTGDLVALRLAREASIVVASPALCRRIGRLDDLDAIPWINWGPDLAAFPDARWIAEQVDPAQVVLRSSSMDAQIQAARAGLGAMLMTRPFAAWTDLTEVPMTRALRERAAALPIGELWLVGHRALRDVPRIRAVWEYIVEQSAGFQR